MLSKMNESKMNPDCICYQKWLDAFMVTLKTDEFAPKARRGDQLLMMYGGNAQSGDIVAIHIPNTPNFTLVRYSAGVKYHATAALVSKKVDDNAQCVIHWFPSFSIHNLFCT